VGGRFIPWGRAIPSLWTVISIVKGYAGLPALYIEANKMPTTKGNKKYLDYKTVQCILSSTFFTPSSIYSVSAKAESLHHLHDTSLLYKVSFFLQ
jgi:hypothetical protein